MEDAREIEWDVFISHASEDKDGLVRSLANRLQEAGLRVWYDEFTLTVGDSLRRSIDRGLAKSRYGIVVISPDFLKKEWPQRELDGLVAREIGGVKVILPVWHNITAADLRAYSPTLADRLAVSSAQGLDTVTARLLEAIRQKPAAPRPATSAPIQDPLAQRRALTEYAASVHNRGVAQLVAGKGPIPILDGGALVMHVIPFGAIDDKASNAFDDISRNALKLPMMSGPQGRNFRISYDGLLVGSNAEGLSKPQRAYAAVSRAAVIESVESSLARGHGHNLLQLPALQASIIRGAHDYARILSNFSVAPPFAVCVSLINVQDMTLLQDFLQRGQIPEDMPSAELDRSQLDFGQAIFEAVPAEAVRQSYIEIAKALKPILTHLANTAGLHSSPYFDAAGNYTLADRF